MMRLFNNEKKIVVINRKKIMGILVVLILLLSAVCLHNGFKVYSQELRSMMKIKSNNIFQKTVNDAVLKACESNNYKFTDIVYSEGRVITIDYNTKDINLFKAEVTDKIIDNINNKKCDFIIYLTDAFKNPFLLNKGPCFNVSCVPHSGINVECFSKFEDAGVNQTKNSIWFEIKTDVYASSAVFNTVNTFKYSVAVSETVIVGEVPESYTNVSEDDNTKDTVLNLQ